MNLTIIHLKNGKDVYCRKIDAIETKQYNVYTNSNQGVIWHGSLCYKFRKRKGERDGPLENNSDNSGQSLQ